MSEQHPNVRLIQRFDPRDPEALADVFAEDAVWHFFNPRLPEMQGDHVGPAGIGAFFAGLGGATGGTFRVQPVSVTPAGDELVVTHTKNSMALDGQEIEIDVVEVWRIVEGKVTEVWDIPSVHVAAQASR